MYHPKTQSIRINFSKYRLELKNMFLYASIEEKIYSDWLIYF